MITLLTGLPGNGKTLFALWHIKQKAEKEQREVYYHNIKDLTLPWTPFEPERWMDLPKGSIIVIDECQFIFPKKPNGSKLPEHYEQLAVHRHGGFDIYLITQHPTLLDIFVRQLVGQHFHTVRKFGLQRSTVFEWSACNPAPQNPSSQKSAIPLKWPYPKEVFGYYKSAEVHTVKRQIPAKIFLALLLVVCVLGAGYWSLNRYQHRFDKQKGSEVVATTQAQPAAPAGPVPAPVAAPAPVQPPFDPVADAKHYVEMQTPRIAGLPQTAPKYDPLTVPRRVPVPAACIQIGSVRDAQQGKEIKCKCFTQQGTPMDVEFNMCIQFARNGYFQDFDPDPDRRMADNREAAHAARADESVAVLANRPDAPLPVHAGGSQLMTIPDLTAPAASPSAKPPAVPDTGPPNNRATRAAPNRFASA